MTHAAPDPRTIAEESDDDVLIVLPGAMLGTLLRVAADSDDEVHIYRPEAARNEGLAHNLSPVRPLLEGRGRCP